MKKILKRMLLYVMLPLAGLIVVLAASLIIYYDAHYEPNPLPDPATRMQVNEERTPFTQQPLLLPVPKSISWKPGVLKLKDEVEITGPATDTNALMRIWTNRMNKKARTSSKGQVTFVHDTTLMEQEHQLYVTPEKIIVRYHHPEGAFHALTTLRQIALQYPDGVPAVEIKDHPDMRTRGAMIDISRGKVPTLETLYRLVDLMADLKYNHLQLYIEGFSFGYPSFARFWEQHETPLLPEEIRALDQYCRERYIELVPNQNSLGHMQDWLKQEEFADLAECPEGYKLLGLIEVKTTISPTDPRSLTLVKQMSEDLLPNFTSQRFNVNLDEPFELGKSKQRPLDDPREIAALYLEYARKLNDYVNSKGKSMMMWGDVVSRTPEVLPQIPSNITLLEWRYEAMQEFEAICKMYQQAGRNYFVCPGTSSWSSFTGRTDNMLGNVSDAIENGVKYGAEGVLITDWGDTPHTQYLTVSYAGLTYAGALSWNVQSKSTLPLEAFLGKMVFKDSTASMGKLVMDAGRYTRFEEYPMMAMTTTNFVTRFGMVDPLLSKAIQTRLQRGLEELGMLDSAMVGRIRGMFANAKVYDGIGVYEYMKQLEVQLSRIHLSGDDGQLILDEYTNGIRMVKVASMLKHYNLHHLEQSDNDNRALLTEIKTLCDAIIAEHERLWMARNKRGGYAGSIEAFIKLQRDAGHQLQLLDSNPVRRWFSRSFEKIIAAAGALYLGQS